MTETAMITGISTTLTMKALLRTSVANSDWATIRVFRMCLLRIQETGAGDRRHVVLDDTASPCVLPPHF